MRTSLAGKHFAYDLLAQCVMEKKGRIEGSEQCINSDTKHILHQASQILNSWLQYKAIQQNNSLAFYLLGEICLHV